MSLIFSTFCLMSLNDCPLLNNKHNECHGDKVSIRVATRFHDTASATSCAFKVIPSWHSRIFRISLLSVSEISAILVAMSKKRRYLFIPSDRDRLRSRLPSPSPTYFSFWVPTLPFLEGLKSNLEQRRDEMSAGGIAFRGSDCFELKPSGSW